MSLCPGRLLVDEVECAGLLLGLPRLVLVVRSFQNSFCSLAPGGLNPKTSITRLSKLNFNY